MDELNLLRQQMLSMKRSLDKYEIVTEQLMRSVMRQRARWLNDYIIFEIIAYPLIILSFWGFFKIRGMTQWLTITFAVIAGISTIFDFKTLRISPKIISEYNLYTLRKKLLIQKRQRRLQFCIELPLVIIWLVWFFLAWFKASPMFDNVRDEPIFIYIGIVLIAGAVITSVLISMWLYLKAQRTNDNLICDIDNVEYNPPVPPLCEEEHKELRDDHA